MRNHSKYLLNGGLWGKLNIAGLLASGVLSNLMMILPIPLFLACGLAALKWLGFWNADAGEISFAFGLFVLIAIAAGFTWLLLPIIQRVTQHAQPEECTSKFRSVWEFVTLACALVALVVGFVSYFPQLLNAYLAARDWLHDTLHWLTGFSPSEIQMVGISGMTSILLGAGGFLIKNKRLHSLALQLFSLSGTRRDGPLGSSSASP